MRALFALFNPSWMRWVAVAAWMAGIFALSAQSRLPGLPAPFFDLLLKKTGHFLEYGVLALLLRRALEPYPGAWGWSWLLAVLYACSDEWHQSFVPGRNPSPWDVVIDGAGAATALVVMRLVVLCGWNSLLPWVQLGERDRAGTP